MIKNKVNPVAPAGESVGEGEVAEDGWRSSHFHSSRHCLLIFEGVCGGCSGSLIGSLCSAVFLTDTTTGSICGCLCFMKPFTVSCRRRSCCVVIGP